MVFLLFPKNHKGQVFVDNLVIFMRRIFEGVVGLYPIQGSCTGIQGHRRANGSRASALYDVINTENIFSSSFMILTAPATVG